MNRKSIIFFVVTFLVSASVLLVHSCTKEEDDNTPLFAGLLLLLNNNAQQAAASTQAAQAVAGISAANSVVSSQASGSTLTLNDFNISEHEIAMNMAQKHLDMLQGKDPVPHFIPTALTTTTGSCNSTSCSAVIDGTANCSLGGTFTLSSYSFNSTISNSGGVFSFNTTVNGGIGFNACSVQAMDLMNFPNYTQTTLGGNVTVSGTSNISLTLATSTSVVANNLNIRSSDLKFNGGSPMAIDMNETSNLTQVASVANSSTSTSGSVTTTSFTLTVVLTGTISRTGTVGGVSVSNSRTFNGDSYTMNVSCTFDSAAQISSCSMN